MFCKNCGAQVNDNSAVCQNCGAQLTPPAQPVAAPYQQQAYQQPNYRQPVYQAQQNEEVVSTGSWVGYQLIPLIPAVGGIIYLVMLFVWAFGDSKPATFRNWAKSQLIIMLIGVVLSIIVTVIITMLGVNLFNELSRM